MAGFSAIRVHPQTLELVLDFTPGTYLSSALAMLKEWSGYFGDFNGLYIQASTTEDQYLEYAACGPYCMPPTKVMMVGGYDAVVEVECIRIEWDLILLRHPGFYRLIRSDSKTITTLMRHLQRHKGERFELEQSGCVLHATSWGLDCVPQTMALLQLEHTSKFMDDSELLYKLCLSLRRWVSHLELRDRKRLRQEVILSRLKELEGRDSAYSRNDNLLHIPAYHQDAALCGDQRLYAKTCVRQVGELSEWCPKCARAFVGLS